MSSLLAVLRGMQMKRNTVHFLFRAIYVLSRSQRECHQLAALAAEGRARAPLGEK